MDKKADTVLNVLKKWPLKRESFVKVCLYLKIHVQGKMIGSLVF